MAIASLAIVQYSNCHMDKYKKINIIIWQYKTVSLHNKKVSP